MAFRHPLAFLLGVEGIALLRAYAGDFSDPAFSAQRIGEVRAVLAAHDRGDLPAAGEIGSIGTVAGYRSWSAHWPPSSGTSSASRPTSAARPGRPGPSAR